MPTPAEKLAKSLEVLRKLQNKNGIAVIKSGDISRTHKDRLLKNGFIQEIMKGWYVSSRPEGVRGDSTSWYTAFWYFCEVYLNNRFGSDWCISPEQSISIHSGNWTIPQQLIIRSQKAGKNVINLPYNTSLVDAPLLMPPDDRIIVKNGIRLFPLPAALIACSQNYFSLKPTDARTALATIKDASEVLALLLEGGNSTIAGRLAGAFRNIGNERIADDIIKTMKAAGYDIRENDPFGEKLIFSVSTLGVSPYVNRIKVMWGQMRETVLKLFPVPPGIPNDKETYMKQVNDTYVTDAYHSLSIEGYRVTPELIKRVMSGNWNPEEHEKDKEQKNAMAARGYYLAFEAVKKSIEKILIGQNPGKVTDEDHGNWYREMFTPSVTAGLLKRSDLAGYRTDQVYITKSAHIPLSPEGVRDAMPTLFELLQNEKDPAVRAVLGHFILVYIHPYTDGNGRIARFLMNVMLASGGYPWTVIPIEKRDNYMSALEKASVEQDISDFAKFIANLVAP